MRHTRMCAGKIRIFIGGIDKCALVVYNILMISGRYALLSLL